MSFMPSFSSSLRLAAAGAALCVAMAGAASAQQCPDWQLNGVPITTDAETAWVPQQYQIYAGGGLDLGQCTTLPGVQGYGRVTPQPSFTINYDSRNMGRDLEFRVQSECDTTMLINDSSGQWMYQDDSDGTLQPRVRLPNAPTGRYDVWVGTFGSSACQATLVTETFPPSGGGGQTQPAACPEWSLGGAEVHLSAGGNESRPVVAGGQVSLFQNQCNVPGHGYVAQAPDFSLYYDPQGQQDATLTISVQGQCDTVLLVNDPTTAWLFDDDTNQLQPALTIPSAPAGRYDIWVGTFSSSTCQSSISISAAAPMPQAPAGK
ncbi:MAG: hypothetical protein H6899_02875 [Rhodobacter sp.]|nr:hypothetical protein [Paracoccaceae bacterium]MCB1409057.1 hypothetical protein [Paracoccaceae bacterium]MCC0078902.1 hypothetical protein [Rhodobacter sp.]